MIENLYHIAAVPFEAARQVNILPKGHRSSRLHGHSFLARVRAALPADWSSFPGAEIEELRTAVEQCVTRLDYELLNNYLKVPTDENLAKWISQGIDIPGVKMVGVQSTHNEGADLDLNGHAHIWRRYRFESAHHLPNVPDGHPCGRIHGHGFEVILHANQSINEQDMGVDYDFLDKCWAPLHKELDHTYLNDIPGLENPTSEMIAAWVWKRMKEKVPQLSWVTVYETVTAGCHFDGTHYRIWKEQRFESALRLQYAPIGDRRRKLHGHSYLLRLHLTSPLDRVMGWTVDYGDVKQTFKPVYKILDHHLLDEVEGILDTNPASIAKWIRHRVGNDLPQLDRIDLYQTPGCGAIYSWGQQGPALPT